MGKKNTMSTIVRAALLLVIVITALALMKCTVLIMSFVFLCLPADSYLVCLKISYPKMK